ncbi:tetratricopeptide repeat protein, partial [Klebsiella pneumoniae]|uniref:tetratricopeptide repeat protein n=1 Tax=Klebsiella pneumoniae TaxID=573 RepID=UPI00272F8269
ATLTAMNNLGVLHMRAGEPERAEQVFSELLALSERKYGRNHRTVAGQYQNLGTVIGRQGRLAEALPHHRQAYEIFSNLLPGH